MARRSGKRHERTRSDGKRPGVWLGALAVLVVVACMVTLALWRGGPAPPSATRGASDPARPQAAAILPDQEATYASYAGSASCRECHEEAFEAWAASNHGLAERPVSPALDSPAFEPPRVFHHASQATAVRLEGTNYLVTATGLSRAAEPHPVVRVIGHDPLRQFLVSFPGGRLQTLEAAFDPHTNDWFNVYGNEDRQPGEWGHWTGRGMNWNNMCAGCHNVRVRKNYEPSSDTYHTAMVEAGVGCESCHGPLKAHVDWRQANRNTLLPDPTIAVLSTNQVIETCATCHSRRAELTGDFAPGDSYHDHFSLIVVDENDTYHPDGQVRDENYEYAAFLGSRMGKAGVRCLDCHHPHSLKPILPGNWLCMRCHTGNYPNAPAIEPVSHSRHRVFGYSTNGVQLDFDLTAYDPRTIAETGGECVNCHMPQTVYMQRHWRHDHGFTVPDPLLTKQEGIPNACNRCHADKSVDWALDYVQQWYGGKMDRPSRQRAQTVAAARRGDRNAHEPTLGLLTTEENPYWRAAAAELLERWAAEPSVTLQLRKHLEDPHPLVREKAVRSLGALASSGHAGVASALVAKLEDPARVVRVAAALALRDRVQLDSRAGRELLHMLELNADQPTGQLQKGAFHLARHQLAEALAAYQKAVDWDPNSPPLRHELAIVLSMAGRSREAIPHLEAACRLDPHEAEYPYKLGLAWNEAQDLDRTLAALGKAVALDPRHGRAWYNLGLAQNQSGRPDEAIESLLRGETADPQDPRIPYARATVLAQQGRNREAIEAARRALELDRAFTPAQALLDQLNRP